MAYTSKTKENLPVYGIRSKDLREFQTTDKDVEKGISRIPLKIARIYEEDILDKMDNDGHSAQLKESPSILENYTSIMEERKEAMVAYTKAKSKQSLTSQVADNDEVFGSERSSTIYTKSSADTTKVSFEDLQIISIIGKGTFGKVQ